MSHEVHADRRYSALERTCSRELLKVALVQKGIRMDAP